MSQSFIPEAWQRQLAEDLMRQHDENWEHLRSYLDTLPKPPRHKIIWRRLTWRITSAREWMALKIAPWLRRDDW